MGIGFKGFEVTFSSHICFKFCKFQGLLIGHDRVFRLNFGDRGGGQLATCRCRSLGVLCKGQDVKVLGDEVGLVDPLSIFLVGV